MPKPKASTDGGSPEKEAPQKSFQEIAAESQAASTKRIEDLARVVATAPKADPSQAEKPAAEAEAETKDDYETWFNAQPAERREEFARNVANGYANSLAELYGPEVSSVLAEVRSSPELKKKFERLSKTEVRDWLFNTALDIYEDPKYAGEPEAERPDSRYTALEEKYNALESKLTAAEETKLVESYTAERQTEYQALVNTYPELRFEDPNSKVGKRVTAVIEDAEEKSRKAGRKIAYADVYVGLKDMWDAQEENPPPRPVPATSASAKDVPRPQAPRTKVETRSAINATVQKYGSLTELQRALRS